MVGTGSDCIKVIHFLLQDVRCCLELDYVERVLPLPLLEASPYCPAYFTGLMNFKGKCVPVIDLAMSIGLQREQTYPLNIPLLLCVHRGHPFAFIVDKVIGLGDIDEKKIEIHDEFTQSDSPFLGAVTLDAGVTLLLNINWMFSLKLTQEINLTPTAYD